VASRIVGRRTLDGVRRQSLAVLDDMTQQRVYRKPHIVVSVVAAIVDDRDQVVLTRRSIPPFFDQWVMPGGKVSLGESVLRALHREVREEIGIEVAVEALVDIFEHLTPGPENDHFVILYYRCRPLRRDLVANQAEVSEARWVPRTDLPCYAMPDGTRFILGKLFPEVGLLEPGLELERTAELELEPTPGLDHEPTPMTAKS
jgi:8-oxo-dGTP diphosphatase